MRRVLLGVVVGVVLFSGGYGCSDVAHQRAADEAQKIQQTLKEIQDAVGSQSAKTVSGLLSSLPTPLAPVVEPARSGIEWGAGIVASLAGVVAAWQAKKAREERAKKRVYKAALPKAALDTANKSLYGSDFKASLSK